MPFFGELFASEILKKPVLDPKGEELGKVKDLMVVKGEPLPKVSSLIIERKRKFFKLAWTDLNIFNKRIISANVYRENLEPYELTDSDLLMARDIFDKQIVDVNGAKAVKVNDVRLGSYEENAILLAADVGITGMLRRLGVERFSKKFMKMLSRTLPENIIVWNYIQPLKPKLKNIALTIPRQKMSEMHPADIAEIISKITKEDGRDLLKDLDIETAAETVSELAPEIQTEMISEMDTEKAADIIEEMPPDEAADILGELPAEKARQIFQRIEKEEAAEIQELLVHEKNTAGGLMTNQFVSFPSDATVKAVIESFKKYAEEIESVYYIYIVDVYERLVGVVSLRDLLLADPLDKLENIMETKIKNVPPDEDVDVVAEMMSKYDLVAMPVVDDSGVFHGIVTVDDIMDVMEEKAAKDISQIAGTSEIKFGSIEEAHAVDIVRTRLPWLMLCLVGGLISSLVIGRFEKTVTAVVVMAAFIPVIMGMAGNAGLQVSTTMVRSLALNSINNYWKYVGKELFSGVIIASVTGIFIALAAGFLKGMPMLGLVVGISMFLSISSSTVLAILTPTIADKIGIDPAITAGPFVTVFNDILGLTIYFTVANLFISYLI